MSLVMMTAALVAPGLLSAQNDGIEKKETEQIIITRKADKDGKIVVEVNGDKVTVNGKPIDELKGEEITVRRTKIKDMNALSGDVVGGRGGGVTMFRNSPNSRVITYGNAGNRAVLGVTTDKTDAGVEVKSVSEKSGAEKAGLKKGDIITKVGDEKIETPDDLTKAIRSRKPGDKVTITYLRDKKQQTANAELGKLENSTAIAVAPGQSFNFDINRDLNMDLQELIPRIQNLQRGVYVGGNGPRLGLSVQDTEDGKGVKVLEVDEEGNGAKAGIKKDDIITSVDGKAVNGADEIARVMRESREKTSVKMQVLRKGKTETLDVKIPRRLKSADL